MQKTQIQQKTPNTKKHEFPENMFFRISVVETWRNGKLFWRKIAKTSLENNFGKQFGEQIQKTIILYQRLLNNIGLLLLLLPLHDGVF